MKLFISYRRKTWAFAQTLNEKLSLYIQDEIFMDVEGVDEANFENSLLKHLRKSNAMLLVVTEFTFSERIHNHDDWVRKEIREALVHKIPIVLVCQDGLFPPNHGLPDDIKDVVKSQGIPFYPQYVMPAIERLAEFLVKMGVAQFRNRQAIEIALAQQSEPNPFAGQKMVFVEDAVNLIESEELDKVEKGIFILEELLKTGYQSQLVYRILDEARKDREKLWIRRIAINEYEEIRLATGFKRTENVALDEFRAWAGRYPHLVKELDTENFRKRVQKKTSQPIATNETSEAIRLLNELNNVNVPHLRRLEIGERLAEIGDPRRGIGVYSDGIPDIAWCSVHAGLFPLNRIKIEVGDYNKKRYWFRIKPFFVARYLTTNAQYQAFVDAPDGYENPEWWKLFPKEYRMQKLKEPANKLSNAPRDSISWYQSMAFAHWLDAKYRQMGLFERFLKLPSNQWYITLPPEWYWQWMAQGGNRRLEYPWGKWDDIPRTNIISKQSTVVGMYPHGIAKCGAYDVAGNLLEWCLNDFDSIRVINGYTNNQRKLLRGGSFYNYQDDARAVYRSFDGPYYDNYVYGCRVFVVPIVS